MLWTGPVSGLAVQTGVLLALAGLVGLTRAGWVLGLGYAMALTGLLTHGLRRSEQGRLSPADWITLTRAILVGAVLALSASVPGSVRMIVAIAALALLLDAVDGWIARRTGTASPLGARFDMEVDSFLLLVLAIYVARSAGAWIATIGLMRYLYAAAGWALPWLHGRVPYRYWRKVVAVVQGIVLTCAATGIFPTSLMHIALGAALALLVESFGRDVVWLAAQRGTHLTTLGRLAFPVSAGSLAWDGQPLLSAGMVAGRDDSPS
ncbi:CDP-alcohol phosphatidyltransferase family protein [Phytohabitans sp. LJ34]|uniref:CDP-alcohol phosphatidyltransferase family protein n=1 Tax=Phytohabitans sp. LJ34 TaxID=3452217 RepID=UPI003F886D20